MCDCSFDNAVQTDYGVEDGQQNPFDMGRVEIPGMVVNLSDREMQIFRTRYDPLSNSDYSGLDLFIEVYD